MSEPVRASGGVSPSTEPSLEGACLRVDRAGEHIEALRQLQQGLAEGIGTLRVLPGTETREQLPDGRWQYASPVIELPELPPPDLRWSLLVGEAIYNLRAALDYLVYALAHLDSGSPQKWTRFPIFRKKEDFEAKSPGYLKGANHDHVKAIEALQPFASQEDDSDWLARLADLSNPDKHRHLVPTLPANELLAELEARKHAAGLHIDGTVRVSPSPVIVFADAGDTPVVAALQLLAARVEQTLDHFAPAFRAVKG